MALHDLTPQLRTRLRRMEKLVGLFVSVAALTLLAGFVYYVYHTAQRKGWFTPKVPYYTFVRNAEGLNVGDPVLLMGFSVGEIDVIEAQPPASYYNVYVGFRVKRPYYGYIWTDSVARITPGSLLGGRKLEVTKGTDGKPTVVEEDGEPARIRIAGELVALEEHEQGVMLEPEEAPALAERADALVAKAEEMLPRLVERAETTLSDASSLLRNVDALVGRADPVLGNLRQITDNLRDPDGSLGEWLLPSELRQRVEGSLDGVDANLSVLTGTLRNLDAITGTVREELERNRDVLGEVSDLVRDTDDLVQGLKRHWLLRSAFPVPEPGREQVPLEPLPGLPPSGAP